MHIQTGAVWIVILAVVKRDEEEDTVTLDDIFTPNKSGGNEKQN